MSTSACEVALEVVVAKGKLRPGSIKAQQQQLAFRLALHKGCQVSRESWLQELVSP